MEELIFSSELPIVAAVNAILITDAYLRVQQNVLIDERDGRVVCLAGGGGGGIAQMASSLDV